MGFPGGSDGKESACYQGELGFILDNMLKSFNLNKTSKSLEI